ncbi:MULTISPECIES: hypothetical protein [unclassified Thiocapsa]|uniref:hypothetical protein n=1 Tax=unclassified Thiocapsa TaxID=2641286 RepID=UPI0035B0B630
MFRPPPFHLILSATFTVAFALPTSAHVPYFEHLDWSSTRPFVVRGEIEQSIAVYSWIDDRSIGIESDVDFYRFQVEAPAEVYIEVIVPACIGYEDFMPWFALIGPGLPAPILDLPESVEIPPGQGAIVIPGPQPGEPRDSFYEPFGGKTYFSGQLWTQPITEPGAYQVIFWDPYGIGGDYVAVLGDSEIWNPRDIARAMIYTPLIRRDRELHIQCLSVEETGKP